MQETLRQQDREVERRSFVEGRRTIAFGDDGAPLSQSSSLATLIILAVFEFPEALKGFKAESRL